MCVEEESFALGLEFEHEILDHLATDGIETTHRLIEKYHFWIMEYRLRESDALEHTLGVGIESLVTSSRETDFFEDFCLSFFEIFTVKVVELAIEFEKLISGEILVEICILRHESYTFLNRYISW